MLFPPCDEWRYDEIGAQGHDSCGGNLRRELAGYISHTDQEPFARGAVVELESTIRRWGWTPEPLNLFMNVPVSAEDGQLRVKRPDCSENDFVILEALVKCLVVMSACPNDVSETNGGSPGTVTYEVMS